MKSKVTLAVYPTAKRIAYFVAFCFTFWGLLTACSDTVEFTTSTDAKLRLSIDTLHFDTVFTSIGSTTLQFRIYNPNKDAVRTDISLGAGDASFFRFNADGQAARSITGLEILGNDSAYVFVEVNVDPRNSNNPVVINDSMVFVTNGNVQDVNLVAYGQDVHLLDGELIKTQTWIADKPYLIYNSIVVDSAETLNINKGVTIYLHDNSSIYVDGSLKVSGTKEAPVTFRGDRLDDWYHDSPGQWGYINKDGYMFGGIHLSTKSHDNVINGAIIKDGIKGIQIDYFADSGKPKLILSNSVIENMSLAGIYAQTTNLLVYNTVISNCGYYAVALIYGGNYEFYHTTIGNYYPANFGLRQTPSVIFNNYYYDKDKVPHVFGFSARFGNCIIHGNYENELAFDKFDTQEVSFGFLFDHCLLKVPSDFNLSDTNIYKSITQKGDSGLFVNTSTRDFHLDSLSIAKNKGSKFYNQYFPLDLDGISRDADEAPDLGAYEYVKK